MTSFFFFLYITGPLCISSLSKDTSGTHCPLFLQTFKLFLQWNDKISLAQAFFVLHSPLVQQKSTCTKCWFIHLFTTQCDTFRIKRKKAFLMIAYIWHCCCCCFTDVFCVSGLLWQPQGLRSLCNEGDIRRWVLSLANMPLSILLSILSRLQHLAQPDVSVLVQ